MAATIVVLAGDGIGPEVIAPTLRLLRTLGDFDFLELPLGGASIDRHGVPIADEVLRECERAEAVLVGAAGGPKWETEDPAAPRAEQGLLTLRRHLGLYANLRPIRALPALTGVGPLRPELVDGTDMLIVRELTGGLYFGARGRDGRAAFDTCTYTVEEIERIARVAFRAARSEVTSVDKANVLDTSRLWREVVERVHRDEFPGVGLRHLLVDTAAMQLMTAPSSFDVLVTENMFGDILSDEASVLVGSIGLVPSASLGDGSRGLYEPIHGSAPDIAGRGTASPLGMFLAGALMLRHSLAMPDEATAIESAVAAAVDAGLRTPDLGGASTTAEATGAVLAHLGS